MQPVGRNVPVKLRVTDAWHGLHTYCQRVRCDFCFHTMHPASFLTAFQPLSLKCSDQRLTGTRNPKRNNGSRTRVHIHAILDVTGNTPKHRKKCIFRCFSFHSHLVLEIKLQHYTEGVGVPDFHDAIHPARHEQTRVYWVPFQAWEGSDSACVVQGASGLWVGGGALRYCTPSTNARARRSARHTARVSAAKFGRMTCKLGPTQQLREYFGGSAEGGTKAFVPLLKHQTLLYGAARLSQAKR